MAGFASILSGNDSLYTELMKENLEKRILIINQDIDENIIEDFSLYIMKWNSEDNEMCIPKDNRTPIRIYINSSGGSVFDCFGGLIDIILSSETPVWTIALGLVASAAFHIYIAGHKRIAFTHSILLQHDGEITVSNSGAKAKQTMRFFDDMEDRTKEYVLSRTSMSEEFYDKVYDQEYWFYADDEGKTLGCVDAIVGKDIDLKYVI